MATQNKRKEKQHIETVTKKERKGNKKHSYNTSRIIKIQSPKDQQKTRDRNSDRVLRYEKKATHIILRAKTKRNGKFIGIWTNKLPTLLKPSDTFLDYLNYQINFLKGKDILTKPLATQPKTKNPC